MFCVFLTVYLEEFFMFLALHYVSMLVWVLAMGSNFCGSIDGVRRPISELVYNLVIAAVLLFDIVNITEGATRLKNVFFYVLSGLEQAALLGAWYLAVSRWAIRYWVNWPQNSGEVLKRWPLLDRWNSRIFHDDVTCGYHKDIHPPPERMLSWSPPSWSPGATRRSSRACPWPSCPPATSGGSSSSGSTTPHSIRRAGCPTGNTLPAAMLN